MSPRPASSPHLSLSHAADDGKVRAAAWARRSLSRANPRRIMFRSFHCVAGAAERLHAPQAAARRCTRAARCRSCSINRCWTTAQFVCDLNALAWHVKIAGGLVQVADQALLAAARADWQVVPASRRAGLTELMERRRRDRVGRFGVVATAYQRLSTRPIPIGPSSGKSTNRCASRAPSIICCYRAVYGEMLDTLKIGAPGERLDVERSTRAWGNLSAASTSCWKQSIPIVLHPARPLPCSSNSPVRRGSKTTASVANEPFVPGYS